MTCTDAHRHQGNVAEDTTLVGTMAVLPSGSFDVDHSSVRDQDSKGSSY